jgi:competence protein ComFB
MEDIVDLLIPKIVNEYGDVCTCEECIEDIKAITLNHLKPYYVASERGHVFTKINELVIQFRTDVIKEAVIAIDVVSKNPRHKEVSDTRE